MFNHLNEFSDTDEKKCKKKIKTNPTIQNEQEIKQQQQQQQYISDAEQEYIDEEECFMLLNNGKEMILQFNDYSITEPFDLNFLKIFDHQAIFIKERILYSKQKPYLVYTLGDDITSTNNMQWLVNSINSWIKIYKQYKNIDKLAEFYPNIIFTKHIFKLYPPTKSDIILDFLLAMTQIFGQCEHKNEMLSQVFSMKYLNQNNYQSNQQPLYPPFTEDIDQQNNMVCVNLLYQKFSELVLKEMTNGIPNSSILKKKAQETLMQNNNNWDHMNDYGKQYESFKGNTKPLSVANQNNQSDAKQLIHTIEKQQRLDVPIKQTFFEICKSQQLIDDNLMSTKGLLSSGSNLCRLYSKWMNQLNTKGQIQLRKLLCQCNGFVDKYQENNNTINHYQKIDVCDSIKIGYYAYKDLIMEKEQNMEKLIQLQMSDFTIAGSAILANMCKQLPFQPSDVDIFVKCNKFPWSILKVMLEQGYELSWVAHNHGSMDYYKQQFGGNNELSRGQHEQFCNLDKDADFPFTTITFVKQFVNHWEKSEKHQQYSEHKMQFIVIPQQCLDDMNNKYNIQTDQDLEKYNEDRFYPFDLVNLQSCCYLDQKGNWNFNPVNYFGFLLIRNNDYNNTTLERYVKYTERNIPIVPVFVQRIIMFTYDIISKYVNTGQNNQGILTQRNIMDVVWQIFIKIFPVDQFRTYMGAVCEIIQLIKTYQEEIQGIVQSISEFKIILEQSKLSENKITYDQYLLEVQPKFDRQYQLRNNIQVLLESLSETKVIEKGNYFPTHTQQQERKIQFLTEETKIKDKIVWQQYTPKQEYFNIKQIFRKMFAQKYLKSITKGKNGTYKSFFSDMVQNNPQDNYSNQQVYLELVTSMTMRNLLHINYSQIMNQKIKHLEFTQTQWKKLIVKQDQFSVRIIPPEKASIIYQTEIQTKYGSPARDLERKQNRQCGYSLLPTIEDKYAKYKKQNKI